MNERDQRIPDHFPDPLRRESQPDEADARRVAVPGAQPQQFDTLVSLGLSARQRGDRAASLAHFEAASAVDPAQVGVKLERANDLRELGRLDEAEGLLRTVMEEHPQHLGAVVGLGHVLRRRGDRTGSLAQFQAAGAVNPNDVGVQTEIAADLRELGHFDDAEVVLRAALQSQPQHFWALVGLGQLLRRRGDRTGSLAQYQAAAAVNPSEIWVQIEIATDLRELGHFDEAETVLRPILQSQPQHFGALVGLGHVRRRRGDRTGSLAQFRAAGAVNPNDVVVQTEIATDLRELGHFDDAEVVLRAALQSQPQHFWALVGLGQLLRRRGDRTGSLAQYQAAAVANPSEIWVQIEIATDLRELGHFDEAETVLRAILQSQPQHFGALVGLGHVRRRRGDRIWVVGAVPGGWRRQPQ